MGLTDVLRDKLAGKKRSSEGNYSEHTEGYGGFESTRRANPHAIGGRRSVGGTPDYSVGLDSALKRNSEAAEERKEKKSFRPYIQKVGRGIDKFNSGIDKFNSGMDKVNSLGASFGGGGSSRRKSSGGRKRSSRSGGSSMFGSSGFDMGDLGFSSFGSVGGGSSRRKSSGKRKASGGRRGGEVPIYQGSRIVGYRRAGSGKKRQQKARSIFDI